MCGERKKKPTFTIVTSFDYSQSKKETRLISQNHRAHALLPVPFTVHITYIYTSSLTLLALTKLIPLNLTVSNT